MRMRTTPAGLRVAALDALAHPRVRAGAQRSAPVQAARNRFVAGPDLSHALDVAADLALTTRSAAIHPLCLPAEDDASLRASRQTCQEALEGAAAIRAALERPDVILSPGDLGLGRSPAGEVSATLAALVETAVRAGVTITLRSAAAGLDDDLLALVEEVAPTQAPKGERPPLRVSVLARRHRSEADCRRLARTGVPVRLVRGGPRESARTAWTDRHEADLAFVRCLSVLLAESADPMIATQDPLLLEVIDAMAEQERRSRDIEYQLYLGVQPDLQIRLADAGHRVRVLVPYGPGWYDYLADLAERPSTTRRMVVALAGRG